MYDPSPATNLPLLNTAAPLGRLDGDSTLLRTLRQMFADDLPGHRENLLAALRESDLEQIARLTHSLRSTSASIGAIRLAELARLVSSAAYSDDREQVRALIPRLDEVIGATLRLLPD